MTLALLALILGYTACLVVEIASPGVNDWLKAKGWAVFDWAALALLKVLAAVERRWQAWRAR